ncbi:kelch-like protein 40 [Convolutriloba macropyga]|uniref:kelch-like protein 40 n=1 Tax=Convolutriloba macropyga TaxID=536237 RepID=UPI003F527251
MSSKKDKSGPFISGFGNWKPVSTTLHNRRASEKQSRVPGVEPIRDWDPSTATAGDSIPEGLTPERFQATMEHLAKQEEDLGSMPPRVYGSLLECNDKVYMLGGTDLTGQPLNTLFMSEDPLTDWYQLPPFKAPKAGMSTHVVDGKIFIFGGSNIKQAGDNSVEIFDTQSQKWSQGKTIPGDTFTGGRTVMHNGLIYLIGGIRDGVSSCLNTIMAYNPETDTWKMQGFPELNYYRYATTLVLKNNLLYISGGREGKLPCDGVECFSFDDNRVSQLATYPSKKVFYQEFHRPKDSDFYLFGGMDYPSTSPNAASEMYRYDIRGNEWERMPDMHMGRADMGVACYRDKLFAIGGVTVNARGQVEPTNQIEVFSPEERIWYKFKNTMPTPRFSPHVLEYKHKLFVYGGFDKKPCGALERLEAR